MLGPRYSNLRIRSSSRRLRLTMTSVRKLSSEPPRQSYSAFPADSRTLCSWSHWMSRIRCPTCRRLAESKVPAIEGVTVEFRSSS